LDSYIAHGNKQLADGKQKHMKISTVYTNEIENFGGEDVQRPGAWEMFKKLRRYGLNRDQVGILIRKFVYEMSNRQILEEMGWTSHSALYRRYREALTILKSKGFKGDWE
jgi:hypothetical protein